VSDAQGYIWFTENTREKSAVGPKSSLVKEYTAPTAKDPHTPVFGADGALWFHRAGFEPDGRLTRRLENSVIHRADEGCASIGIVRRATGRWCFAMDWAEAGARVDPNRGAITEFAREFGHRAARLVAVGNAIYS